ncbi:hypothetical protein NQ315_014514 [Exocentrus adspersus]|uniref:RNase H type-1 domain-containing protein n=1 Tax=Exocentrus adspersus TaxID=1586481 RepID=A0AAV8V9V4_9CUCU|nr:hypothetical protein NQ315_014514 [Exocentrus adspersus]
MREVGGRKEGSRSYCPQGREGSPNICHEGAGIYVENSGVQQSYSLGSYATVFQADSFAILMVALREDECGDALKSLARQKEVGLVWVPGHVEIPGNKRADQLARLGSGESPQGSEPILGISRESINEALSRWAYRGLGISWRMNTGCRQAHNFLDGPDMS